MARRKPRVTRSHLATAMSKDPSTVGHWLSGATPIRLVDMCEICDFLGIDFHTLVDRARSGMKGAS